MTVRIAIVHHAAEMEALLRQLLGGVPGYEVAWSAILKFLDRGGRACGS